MRMTDIPWSKILFWVGILLLWPGVWSGWLGWRAFQLEETLKRDGTRITTATVADIRVERARSLDGKRVTRFYPIFEFSTSDVQGQLQRRMEMPGLYFTRASGLEVGSSVEIKHSLRDPTLFKMTKEDFRYQEVIVGAVAMVVFLGLSLLCFAGCYRLRA
jgi:hypothetical protein